MPAAARSMVPLIFLSGLIISIAMGLRQSLGIFQLPMANAVGVSAAAFGFSIALQNIVWGISQPFVGALADRHGARPVVVGCAVIYAAGLGLMALAGRLFGALEMGGVLVGVGTAGTAFGVLLGTISRAVPAEKRSQTVGLVSAAGSLGTMVMAPTGQAMIAALGWQPAILGFAAVACTVIVLAFFISEQPHAGIEVKKQSLREALGDAVSHRGYLFMTFAFFACGFQLVFLTTHLPAYLEVCGIAPGVGATALALIGLCNAIGTYGFGLLGARYSQKHLLALIYLLRTVFIAIFLVVPISPASTLVFAAAMGFLWLGVTPLVAGIIGRVFGLQHFSTLYGVVFLSHQVGSFFGAWMGGVVYDWRGNYDFAWGALITIGAIAFTLQWLMDERPPRRPVGAAVATA